MRKGKTFSKIFGITLVFVMTAAMVALGGFAFLGQASAQESKTSGTSPQYESLDYFKITEEHGIKYHVTDDWGAIHCNVWAVSQYFETGNPHDLDFVFTLIEEGTEGGFFRNSSIGGQVSRDIDGKNLTLLYLGYPVGNQASFYRNFSLPRFFNSGDEWSTWGDKEYSVEYVGSQTVDGAEFGDCIKITIDDSLNDSEYLRGSGYFILARDIGIVELVFNRTNGRTILYEYIEHEQLTRHTISGTITHGGVPVEGIIVQISNANWGIRSVTDSNGAFSIQVYGPDIILRIGYDEDNDDVFDFDDPNFPREYRVNNITSDITGLSIDIAEFWVSNVAQLRDALHAAESNGRNDVIKIAQGTYNTGGHSFHYRGDYDYDITISGGWSSDFSSQDLDPTNAVLNNDAPPCSPGANVVWHGVLQVGNHGGGDITVEGITVQNGRACLAAGTDDHIGGAGANIFSDTGNINFSHNRAIGNSLLASGGEPGGDWDAVLRGAGLRARTAGDITVKDNEFSENAIAAASVYEGDNIYGAGADILTFGSGNIFLEDNVFSQNSLEESGTAEGNWLCGAAASVWNKHSGNAYISGNIITENTAIGSNAADTLRGAGLRVYTDGGSADVKNNIIASNYIEGNGGDDELIGAGIYWYFGEESKFINNTVAFNEINGGGGSDEAKGGGVGIFNYHITTFFFNNIVGGSTVDAETAFGEDIYNCFQCSASHICYNDYSSLGGLAPANTCPECGAEPWGNVNVDPLFVNPEAGDFHLQAGSPVIDMGTASAPGLPDTDIEGNPRVSGAAPDMGAYESTGAPPDEDNPDVATGLAGIKGWLVMAYGYKAGEGVGGWTVYNPEWATTHPEWNTLTTLYVGRGYWINVSQGCDLTYEANTYHLDEGWNLIGWCGATAVGPPSAEDNPPVAIGLDFIEDQLVIAYGYKAGEGVWGWTVYNPEWVETHPDWNSLTTLYMQRGYWINVSGACSLEYGSQIYGLDPGWNLIGWVGW